MQRLSTTLITMLLCALSLSAQQDKRVVNIVNFIRQNDYRVEQSETKMLETVEKQIALMKQHNLIGTFLLQYDALIDKRYQSLLKKSLDKNWEIGAWWEITQPHIEDAGMTWRGNHRWVSTANIAFTTGYTKEERKQLVDVYMAKFKQIFGYYPKSVGSWYIDAFTLEYMQKKYGIVASCNCKDQVGTDGYTLWGGYWNQAYYPSRLNGYMPAQDKSMQIDVPVFRMLGSDPIYQYDCGLGDNGQGVITLEPVYKHSGQNRQWVETYLDCIANLPSLGFNYTQAGQENSFTWQPMAAGLEMQFPIIAQMAKEGKLRVETMAETGRWFKKRFKVTPPTAVTAMSDTYGNGQSTIWYNSRYYRSNILMTNDGHMRFRDIHLFDQKMQSPYLDTPGQGSYFEFTTLPFVDGFMWSDKHDRSALRLMKITKDGTAEEILLETMAVEEHGNNLSVHANDKEGNFFEITFSEKTITWKAPDVDYRWAMELHCAKNDRLPFTDISPHVIKAVHNGFEYSVSASKGFFLLPTTDKEYSFRIMPEEGSIVIDCTNKPAKPEMPIRKYKPELP